MTTTTDNTTDAMSMALFAASHINPMEWDADALDEHLYGLAYEAALDSGDHGPVEWQAHAGSSGTQRPPLDHWG